jgi:hypothetical protein
MTYNQASINNKASTSAPKAEAKTEAKAEA